MDLPAEVVGPDAWTYGKNILMQDDRTLAALGPSRVWGTPIARPIWAASAPFGPINRAVYGGTAGLYATDGTNHANITPATGFGGASQAAFTGGMFNGIFVANDRAHRPCYWNGSLASLAIVLPAYPATDRARSMRPFKYFLVQIGGIINGADSPNGVRWSSSAAPGLPPTTWTPAAGNDAGYVPLAGAREPLIDAAPLRDTLLVFEPHATWALSYVGGAFVFSNRRILHTAGIISPNAWGTVGSDILFVADGDVLICDGQQVRSILTRRIKSAMFSTINADAWNRCFVAVSSSRNQAIIGFPTGGAQYCNRALVWNFGSDKMGLVDLPNYSFAFGSYLNVGGPDNWENDPEAWDQSLQAWDWQRFTGEDSFIVAVRPDFGATGAFEANERSESPADGPLEVIARKEKMSLEGDDRVKQVTRLYPKMQGPDGCEVFWRVGISMDPGQPPRWLPERKFTIGQDEKIDVRASGRFVSVQLRSKTARAWSCAGFDIEFQDAGAR
jgi:hypothetical protein